MPVSDSDLITPVLLMAMPQVLDPFFHRSVILLLHHEAEGSLGFIVNRPTGIKVSEILKGMDVEWGGQGETVAYFGGPVQPNLGTVLFAPVLPDGDEQDTAKQIVPGLALTQHIGDLSRLAEEPTERFRLLLGYAGWGEGQLMDEILRNDWLTAPVDGDLIFAPDPDQLWVAALRSVGIDPASLPSWIPGGASEESAN
ncbi:MAG TPA: YqgE/AlgH family protein [Thermoanaerobaculia bacterium]|jgi:putative transcriptional regulator|nr:YqgE/AlgH family protein [Thermoanaerobaculia bacterium]